MRLMLLLVALSNAVTIYFLGVYSHQWLLMSFSLLPYELLLLVSLIQPSLMGLSTKTGGSKDEQVRATDRHRDLAGTNGGNEPRETPDGVSRLSGTRSSSLSSGDLSPVTER